MNRRSFLASQAGLAGLGAAPFSSWLTLQSMSQAIAQAGGGGETGYRALVCVFLAGGNDSYNMLMPAPGSDANGNWQGASSAPIETPYASGETAWQGYRRLRRGLNTGHLFAQQGTPLGQAVLPLNAKTGGGLQPLALHGRMPRLQAIFNGSAYTGGGGSFTPSGRHAAFVTNVGTLVEPLSASDARAQLLKRPKNLQSHNDQIMQWQTCFPQGSSGTGWVGRLADQLYSSGNGHAFTMVSLDGVSPALTGSRYQHYTDGFGSPLIQRMSSPITSGDAVDRRYAYAREALQAIADQQITGGNGSSAASSILTRAYARSVLDGLGANEQYQDILSQHTAPPAILSVENTHNMVGKMRRLAHLIKAFRSAASAGGTNYSGPRRQIFFVTLGGWDHHNGAAETHFKFLNLLDGALAEFYAQMQALGALNDVTLFTASDFGRALVPNGDGTDHAWGGNHIVLGGAVNGGDIYGQYPPMLLKGDNESQSQDLIGNGVFVPTLAVDQYMQRLGKWLLVGTGGSGWESSPSQANPEWEQVLPNWQQIKNWNTYVSNLMT